MIITGVKSIWSKAFFFSLGKYVCVLSFLGCSITRRCTRADKIDCFQNQLTDISRMMVNDHCQWLDIMNTKKKIFDAYGQDGKLFTIFFFHFQLATTDTLRWNIFRIIFFSFFGKMRRRNGSSDVNKSALRVFWPCAPVCTSTYSMYVVKASYVRCWMSIRHHYNNMYVGSQVHILMVEEFTLFFFCVHCRKDAWT